MISNALQHVKDKQQRTSLPGWHTQMLIHIELCTTCIFDGDHVPTMAFKNHPTLVLPVHT
jgi:hypothetical protein